MRTFRSLLSLAVLGGFVLAAAQADERPAAAGRAAMMRMSMPFKGVKANTGTVSASHMDGNLTLTLSDDFKTPDTPAPHWQVVDSKGNTYLLQRLVIKGDKFHKSITVPAYVRDIAKVQIWCAWAETLLGEAAFDSPAK